MVINICKCTFVGAQCGEKNQIFSNWKSYLPLGLAYLNVFREKNLKDHYFKHYDLQLHALQFQNLQISTILMERKYVFVLLECYCMMSFHRLKCIGIFLQGSNLVGFECE
jgi:hypothetical protein